jgi:hypothetical protein
MELYKPFKSKKSGKKYSVYVKDRKLIHFGATGYPDFRSGTASIGQRDRYLKRASGIRTKEGKKAYLDKNRPAYWSYHYLWKG